MERSACLQGYLRFATLYPHFDVRFANPSHELQAGLWMLSEPSLPVHDNTGGVVWWQRDTGGMRQLVSHHPRVMNTVRELFEDAWGHFHFRVWVDGKLVTSNEDADPSLTIHFIRQKIAELEDLAVM